MAKLHASEKAGYAHPRVLGHHAVANIASFQSIHHSSFIQTELVLVVVERLTLVGNPVLLNILTKVAFDSQQRDHPVFVFGRSN